MRKILLLFIAILLLVSCQKETKTFVNVEKENTPDGITTASGNKASKISICHKTSSPTNPWISIVINKSDLPHHLAHGDVVPDEDGDSYTKVNPCGTGSQNDCNDNNKAINPGATEICNGIDDNCNGQIDENCNSFVTICNQVWMLKNLDVSTYQDGTPIPEVTDPTEWANLTTGAWCYYENNIANDPVYGKLYNWFAVAGIYDETSFLDPSLRKQLAPTGWHVPSDVEWTTLTTSCLGGGSVAGGKMKETGTTHWQTPNTGATNSSGFAGLPGGIRYGAWSLFGNVGGGGYWWSSSHDYTSYAWGRYLYYSNTVAFRVGVNKIFGFSVRCVKD